MTPSAKLQYCTRTSRGCRTVPQPSLAVDFIGDLGRRQTQDFLRGLVRSRTWDTIEQFCLYHIVY